MKKLHAKFLPFIFCLLAHSTGAQQQETRSRQLTETPENLRHYKDKALARTGSAVFSITEAIDSGQIEITEVYKGTLVYTYSPLNGVPYKQKLQYFDSTLSEVIHSVDLLEMNPFLIDSSTHLAYLDSEEMKIPSPIDSTCQFPELPPPASSFSNCFMYPITTKGFIPISFEHIFLSKDQTVVDWEQEFIVLDPRGRPVFQKRMDYSIKHPTITTDGKYLIYQYGGTDGSNPFDPCHEYFEIIELESSKIIFSQKCWYLETVSSPTYRNEDLFIHVFNNRTNLLKQYRINLNDRTIYLYKYVPEWELLPNTEDYLRFLDALPYETIKF
ncbi:MAG: hypothetical protein R2792_10770 [Saprospiraceae bacterium]